MGVLAHKATKIAALTDTIAARFRRGDQQRQQPLSAPDHRVDAETPPPPDRSGSSLVLHAPDGLKRPKELGVDPADRFVKASAQCLQRKTFFDDSSRFPPEGVPSLSIR